MKLRPMGFGEEHLPRIQMPIRLKASDHPSGGDRQVKDLPPRGGRAPYGTAAIGGTAVAQVQILSPRPYKKTGCLLVSGFYFVRTGFETAADGGRGRASSPNRDANKAEGIGPPIRG
ncbi:MAG: hypothetical protein ACOX4S_09400 [Anaerovoracaceae bacterium]